MVQLKLLATIFSGAIVLDEEAAELRCTYAHRCRRPSTDDDKFELLWINTGEVLVGAIYHPLKPVYQPETLLNHLEHSLEEIGRVWT